MPQTAVQDLLVSVRDHWRLWVGLGMRDIRGRYRRTVIGPFWTVLSQAILVVALGLVYSVLWKMAARDLLPYFCAGYITWMMFTIMVNESAIAFVGADPIIKSLSLPYLIHILRVVLRNLILFAHSLAVYAAVMLYFHIWPGWSLAIVPVSVALLAINLFWISLIVAVACTRFRDLIQVIASIMQVLFFVTPIFWPIERLDGYRAAKFILSDANFVYHLIDVVRAPLIGRWPQPLTWSYLSVTGLIGTAVALEVLNRCRSRLAFWL